MTEPDRPSNWTRMLLDSLVCVYCHATNRPSVYYVTIEPNGRRVCSVCGKDWAPEASA